MGLKSLSRTFGKRYPGMEQIQELIFANGHRAKTARIRRSSELPDTLDLMELHYPRPTLVLVGGASGMSNGYLAQLRWLFTDILSPLADSLGMAVVDGGTDCGIMQLIGQARADSTASFPLIGVAATGTVALPNLIPADDSAPLEPNHTHFFLVPGAFWGDEAPWIDRVASAMALTGPSLTILINGGKIAWQDVGNSVRAGRPVLVVAGSGRTADELANAVWGDRSNERANRLVRSGLLEAVNLTDGTEVLTKVIRRMLSPDYASPAPFKS